MQQPQFFAQHDPECRAYFLRSDFKQAAMVVGFWVISVAMFVVIDNLVAGGERLFTQLLSLRTTFIVVSVLAAMLMLRAKTAQQGDKLLLAWSVLLALWGVGINHLYGVHHPSQVAQDMAILLTFYLMTNGPLLHRLLPALLYSSVDLAQSFVFHPSDLIALLVDISMLVFANGVGFVIARQRIASRISFYALLQAEQALRLEMQALATTDALTGAHNRRHLETELEREFSRAQRHERALGLMMFDIDHFKRVNDTYGHHVGDEALRAFAQVVMRGKREEDLFARYGGEEFVLVTPETDPQALILVAERLRQACTLISIDTSEGQPCQFTVSIGIAHAEPTDVCCQDLLKHADEALYQAKEGGRNQVVHYRAT